MQVGVNGQVQPCQLSNVICGLALVRCGLFRIGYNCSLSAVKLCLSGCIRLLCLLQIRLSGNALVCKTDLVSPVKGRLRGGKVLPRRFHLGLLRAIKLGFGRSKGLLGSLQVRLSGNGLVCKTGLLSPVKGRLRACKIVLRCLNCQLLRAVKRGLGFGKRLLSFLQIRLSVNALVCKTDLMRPIKCALCC